MQIELIGCTSAGKSTLAAQLISAGQQAGLAIETSYDYVLRRFGLGWVRQHKLRMLLLNLLALIAALVTFLQRPALCWWLLTVLRRLPAQVTPGERLKIARITSRNLGIHQLLQLAPADQLIIADEGNIQVAHYLFVHLAVAPDGAALEHYLNQVPLPDLVLYYKQPEALLIERTLRRGHKRIAEGRPDQVQRFIHHAYTTFEQISHAPLLYSQLIIIDGQSQHILQQPPALNRAQQQVVKVLNLLATEQGLSQGVYRTAS